MQIGIQAFDAVTIGGANVLKPAVFKRVIQVITLVLGLVVSIPLIIVDVGCVVNPAAFPPFRLRLGAGRTLCGRLRNVSLVGARWMLLGFFRPLYFGTLGFSGALRLAGTLLLAWMLSPQRTPQEQACTKSKSER